MTMATAGAPPARARPAVGDATERVAALDGQAFDAVVIGAGILGAGVARELARRGRRTLVVDRRDAGWGTTNRSTRLAHGGLRYLEHFDFPLVHEGPRERGWLLRATPRLVTPLGLLLPYYRESWFHRTQLRMGLTLYDILAPRRSLPSHRSVTRAEAVGAGDRLTGRAGSPARAGVRPDEAPLGRPPSRETSRRSCGSCPSRAPSRSPIDDRVRRRRARPGHGHAGCLRRPCRLAGEGSRRSWREDRAWLCSMRCNRLHKTCRYGGCACLGVIQ